MTEETYIKAQGIVFKMHELKKKIDVLKKHKTYYKIICHESYCDIDDEITIPSDIVQEVAEEVVNVLEKRLLELKKELDLL